MADMAVLVPSRGRPGNVARLIDARGRTCQASTVLWFGFDQDDPHLKANIANVTAAGGEQAGIRYEVRTRGGLAWWTNHLAEKALTRWPGAVLCSLGDDHVPLSDGWDESLLKAIDVIDGGWAYPNDHRRDDIAEAVAVSPRIVRELGWMALPNVHHWCIDNAWTKLAATVGRLEYLPDVHVPHYHPHSPEPAYQVAADPTYEEARWSYDLDKRRYLHWRDQGGLARDAAKVREILGMEAAADDAS